MLVVITYDVNTEDYYGKKRLRKVAKCCENYGQRVQNSVFECYLTNGQYLYVKSKLSAIIDKNKDNMRFYLLGNKYQSKIESIGINKDYYDPEESIIL